jgi:hypothetical protein
MHEAYAYSTIFVEIYADFHKNPTNGLFAYTN